MPARTDPTITLRLTSSLMDDVTAFATRHHVSRNAAVMALVAFGLRFEHQLPVADLAQRLRAGSYR